MNPPLQLPVFDAARMAGERRAATTSLDTAGLRAKGAETLAKAVFTARGTSAVFASRIKTVVDSLAAGDIGEGQARTALYETLDALGYTPEGGFPGDAGKVPPALRGTLQDLRSFRRVNLIIQTQLDLAAGAGEQFRGHTPDRLAQFPAWELVRLEARNAPRNWDGTEPGKGIAEDARWTIAGGKLYGGRMIAFKGDPVWGELGSFDNFPDALGTDHPPFAFQSGMGWREIELAECDALGVAGPNGESRSDFFASGPVVMAGPLPLPSPQISMRGVDPALRQAFEESTHATARPGSPVVMDYSDLLQQELDAGRAAYQKANPDYNPEGGAR